MITLHIFQLLLINKPYFANSKIQTANFLLNLNTLVKNGQNKERKKENVC